MSEAPGIGGILDMVYGLLDGSDIVQEYDRRHGIKSAAILTVTDDERAHLICEYLAERIRGKVVVEIGSGIGLLGLHLSQYAKHVYCIEANPAWSWVFVGTFYDRKPKNVSWLFGAADEFKRMIKGDVALFCTHSDHKGMSRVARWFAPQVIDVYDELVGDKLDDLLGPELAEANRLFGITSDGPPKGTTNGQD